MNSSDGILARDIHHLHPVLVGPLIDLLRGPNKLNVGHFHACGFPHFNKVLADGANFFQVAVKLAVEHGEIVGHPEDKNSTGFDHLVDIDSSEESLGDVHSAGGFKAVVAAEEVFF